MTTEQIIEETAASARRTNIRIAPLIYRTPLLPSQMIGKEHGADLLFKAENFQLTGSFKFRGATSMMTALNRGQAVITASSGNHGIACAKAAEALQRRLTVVVPETVSPAKLERIKAFGVEVLIKGADSGLSEAFARSMAAADARLIYVSPYNDLDVIAGQGSIGIELLDQAKRIDQIFIAMGGVGAVLKAANPSIRVVGVSAKN